MCSPLTPTTHGHFELSIFACIKRQRWQQLMSKVDIYNQMEKIGDCEQSKWNFTFNLGFEQFCHSGLRVGSGQGMTSRVTLNLL